MQSKIAYLGPPGTYTEEAAQFYAQSVVSMEKKSEDIFLACMSMEEVVSAVEYKETGFGVLPLENSLEGSVTVTLDLLAASSLSICTEIIRPIEHCLLTKAGDTQPLKKIYSHPQALAQCRHYLAKHCPQAELEPVASTAKASMIVSREGQGKGAIAPARAAAYYNLKIRARGIAENTSNATRFIVVAWHDSPPSAKDKTSIIVGIKDSPGSLYALLGIFAAKKINLTRIESRPARTNIGEYFFFIDFEGHRQQNEIRSVLQRVKEESCYLKILGSYPVYREK
jgi:prephenate dehydratase